MVISFSTSSIDVEVVLLVDVEVVLSTDVEVVTLVDIEVVRSIGVAVLVSIVSEVPMSIDSEVLLSINIDVLVSIDVAGVVSIDVAGVVSIDVEVGSLVSASATLLGSPNSCCSSLFAIMSSSSCIGIIYYSSNDAKNLSHLSFFSFLELLPHHQEICKGRLFQCHPSWLEILVAVD
ncbi:hypothetical protein F2Q68_00009100 [Brassica cretica]|uniref:Uncharacterized protein n=1 Tax=Brassica cretica TaxID=69181 RepID=A0A8S9KYZ9_BRACR|nr:hypothetical protein F2Q68_00009100 [Brassica cretica]